MSLQIEPIRQLTTDETGTPLALRERTSTEVEEMISSGRPVKFFEANVDVLTDDGRPIATTHYGAPAGERLRASVRVAIAQGRIRPEDAPAFLALGETDERKALDALVAQPVGAADDARYSDYAAATGIPQIARPVVPAGDESYLAFAASCGLSPFGTLPPSVEGRRS